MRIAFVADLHGNYPAALAMEKALEKQRVDEIWFLGDAVGKGPESPKTCDWVRANCTRFVGGNWDYGIGGKEYPADDYYWQQLGEERMEWLKNLPRETEATISGVRFRLFHGRPVMPLLQGHDSNRTMATAFEREGEVFTGVIFGDSHRPFIRSLAAGYALNCGSVGNSLGVPNSHALLLEGDVGSPERSVMTMTILSVPYDNRAAVKAALADPDLPYRDAYIREITTGIYSR